MTGSSIQASLVAQNPKAQPGTILLNPLQLNSSRQKQLPEIPALIIRIHNSSSHNNIHLTEVILQKNKFGQGESINHGKGQPYSLHELCACLYSFMA